MQVPVVGPGEGEDVGHGTILAPGIEVPDKAHAARA
jgi:hypothetical protein